MNALRRRRAVQWNTPHCSRHSRCVQCSVGRFRNQALNCSYLQQNEKEISRKCSKGNCVNSRESIRSGVRVLMSLAHSCMSASTSCLQVENGEDVAMAPMEMLLQRQQVDDGNNMMMDDVPGLGGGLQGSGYSNPGGQELMT